MIAAIQEASKVAFPIAFAAGLVSCLSPCVLPLLPGYLGYLSASSGGASDEDKKNFRILIPVAVFIAGFGIVFMLLGLGASAAGQFLNENSRLIGRISGILIIIFGLAFMGVLPIGILTKEKRFHVSAPQTLAGNFVMGTAFGFGWSPCIGPTLSATLLLASQSENAIRGALLLGTYTLGLSVPFVLGALGMSRISKTVQWFRRRQRAIMFAGGGLLVAFGLLMVFDRVFVLSSIIQRWLESIGLGQFVGI